MEATRRTPPPIQPSDRINVEMSLEEASLLYTLTGQMAGYTGDDPTYQMITELYYALQSAGVGRIAGRLTFEAGTDTVEIRTNYKESK